jgi:hypothetical protein
MDVTVEDFEWDRGNEYTQPKSGSIYLVVHVTARNLGPGSVRSFGIFDFQVKDANNVVRDYEYLLDYEDCMLESVDLMADSVLTGCVTFEVPIDGRLDFIYAPYRYEGLTPGRYLDFVLRE